MASLRVAKRANLAVRSGTSIDEVVPPLMDVHYQTSATSGPDWDSVAKEPAVRQHIEELLNMGATTSAKSKMVATSAKK